MAQSNDLETSSKALDQIMKYLTKGPVLALIGFFLTTNIILVVVVVNILINSRDRENKLNDKIIENIKFQSQSIINSKMEPIERNVTKSITKLDSTIVTFDSIITPNHNEK